MILSLEPLLHDWLNAGVNGVYQGMLLAGLVWVALRILKRTNAATRHAVWLVTLLLVAALPGLYFLLARLGADSHWHSANASAAPSSLITPTNPGNSQNTILERAPRTANESAGSFGKIGLVPCERPQDHEPGRQSSSRAHCSASAAAGCAACITPVESALSISPHSPEVFRPKQSGLARSHNLPIRFKSTIQFNKEPAASHDEALSASPGTPDATISAGTSWTRFLFPARMEWDRFIPHWAGLGLFLSWLILAGALCLRLVGEYLVLWRWKQLSQCLPIEYQERLWVIQQDMNARRSAQLLSHPGLGSPIACGFFHPAIIMPASLVPRLSESEMDALFRHEMAHIQRRDDWTNLIQQTIKALLFFHPAVWLAGHRLNHDREIACDDHVLAARREPKAYALFLTTLASELRGRNLAAASGAWNTRGQMKERISMLLDYRRNTSPRLARVRAGALTGGACLAAALIFSAGPRVALALGESTPRATDKAVGLAAEESNGDATLIAADENIVAHLSAGEAVISAALPVEPGARSSGVNLSLSEPTIAQQGESGSQPGPRVRGRTGTGARNGVPAAAAVSESIPQPPKPLPPLDAYSVNVPAIADESLSRRLDRLERLLERLLERQEDRQDVFHDRLEDLQERLMDSVQDDQEAFHDQLEDLTESMFEAQEAMEDLDPFMESFEPELPETRFNEFREIFDENRAARIARQAQAQALRQLDASREQERQVRRNQQRARSLLDAVAQQPKHDDLPQFPSSEKPSAFGEIELEPHPDAYAHQHQILQQKRDFLQRERDMLKQQQIELQRQIETLAKLMDHSEQRLKELEKEMKNFEKQKQKSESWSEERVY